MKPRKDSLVSSLSNTSYQLGELFFTDLDVPDSTFYWLNQARKLGLDSVKSVRSLFVLAEVARAHPEKKYGDEKELYRQIIDKYPKSTYAEEARIALGFPPTPRKVDPALSAFTLAESLMVATNYQGAVDSLRGILRDFPESPIAAKSRYTMAWIYENNLSNPDSALAQYKALAARNANTKYGEAALKRIPPDTTRPAPLAVPKNMTVDSAGKRPGILPEKAPSDSLMKLQQKIQAPPDSLFRKPEFDERPMIRGVGKDSVAGHKVK
jgi:hypothetical protein